MKLLWITNIPSPYRVDFFNELGKSCELTVLFEKAGAEDRDSSWQTFSPINFEAIVLRSLSYSAESAASLGVLTHLRKGLYDAIVVTNFASPTGALAIAYLKATGRRYCLESDGGFPSGSRIKSWVKRHVIGGAQAYFSTSDVHDKYYLAYGAAPHQLIRYPFTSVRAADVLPEPPTAAQKMAAKRRIGVTKPKMVLSVGQFIHRKGYDLLLEACSSLRDDTMVCIVGGEPPVEYRRIVSDLGLSNVLFSGFKQREQLGMYFTAADVFVHPSREDIWGLVVNEALAHALPVITTDRCVAGHELVARNGCGIVVPTESADVIEQALHKLLDDNELRNRMQRRALAISQNYTIEQMAERHRSVFEMATRGDHK